MVYLCRVPTGCATRATGRQRAALSCDFRSGVNFIKIFSNSVMNDIPSISASLLADVKHIDTSSSDKSDVVSFKLSTHLQLALHLHNRGGLDLFFFHGLVVNGRKWRC